jgi:hypothetical protein
LSSFSDVGVPARLTDVLSSFGIDTPTPIQAQTIPLVLEGRDTKKEMTFRYPQKLESVELFVFSYRVGFLILRFHADDPAATFFDWDRSCSRS